ncbi:MAG: hypothetical protein ACOWW1_05535 [archaeon]
MKIQTGRYIDVHRILKLPNYLREHSGIDNKTPAETCGIKIEGQNRWKTIIQNASKKQF